MKMHLLSGGRLRMRKSIFIPDAERTETIEMPVSCALLRHRQGNVLFDTGCHPGVAGACGSALGRTGEADDADHAARRQCHHRARRHRAAHATTSTSWSARICIPTIAAAIPSSSARPSSSTPTKSPPHARPAPRSAGYLAAEWEQAAPTRSDRERARSVRRRPHRAAAAARPYAGHDRRAGRRSNAPGHFSSPPIPSSLRSTLDTGIVPKNTWNADALRKSLDEVRRIEARRRDCAVRPRRRAMGAACAKAQTPYEVIVRMPSLTRPKSTPGRKSSARASSASRTRAC